MSQWNTFVQLIYPNKKVFKKRGVFQRRGKRNKGEWQYNGRVELVQGTLHTCVELAQWNPLLLMCNESKIKEIFKRGRKEQESNRVGEFYQSSLYACMEIIMKPLCIISTC
jgi:hypothetical protein